MSTEKLTPAEVIATRLMGWERDDSRNEAPKQFRDYRPPASPRFCRWESIRIKTGESLFNDWAWPNLESYDGIRAIEDELARRGLLKKYIFQLGQGLALNEELFKITEAQGLNWIQCALLRATTAQRVAAILRVIEEMDRKKQGNE